MTGAVCGRDYVEEYTPDEALNKILAPAGLQAEYVDTKTVAIGSAGPHACFQVI